MSGLNEINNWLRVQLPALLEKHKVPGAAIAVSAGGQVIDLAAGVLSRATGVEATVDSVFQIGSITKVLTSTLLMQLVDEDKLDLDAPVRRYLPELRLADAEAAATITVRQLMCHTAGFEGDLFTDTGRGDDCIEKYVATLRDTAQLFPPGEMFSYNNAGFCVLGRVVEVLRGKPFDACMREHLFTPLGLTHAANNADEAILFRAAVGHIQPTPDADPQPAPIWSLVRSNAPAGSSLAMRPRDLLAFAQMHLSDGKAADGTAVLSAESAQAMRQRQVTLPRLGMMGDAWGLGWEMFDWPREHEERAQRAPQSRSEDQPGGLVIGHDGGTIGQAAMLRVVPGRDVAVALLTNGGNPIALYSEIFGHVLRELAGVQMPPLPAPPAQPTPVHRPERFLGTYASEVADLTVTRDDEGLLWLEMAPKGILREFAGEVERTELVHFAGDTFISAQASHGLHTLHAFVGDDGSGHSLYIHSGRATRRVPAV